MSQAEGVLVTGTGGGVGQSILKCLQDSPYRVVAADGQVLGAGLYAAARSYLVPYASAPNYIDRLCEICARENCKIIFPGLDAELFALANARARFAEMGVTVMVSAPQVIETCDDKWLTFQFLRAHDFYAPHTVPFTSDVLNELSLPFVLKPQRGGARSQGVFVVKSRAEMAYYVSRLQNETYIAQECIDGDEYTCGTLNLAEHCHGVILMRRILRDGDTYKAFVETNDALTDYVRRAAEALQPFGACNFQLRMRDNKPYIFEINARCSGTTHSRALAGFNEPRMFADYVLRGNAPQFSIREIAILRYWQELVVEPQRIMEMQAAHCLDGDGSRM